MLVVKFKLIGHKGVFDTASLRCSYRISSNRHEENQEIACEKATKS
jgi:hypothetical protein